MGEECHYFVNRELPENKTYKIAALAVKLQGLVLDCAVFEDAAWDNKWPHRKCWQQLKSGEQILLLCVFLHWLCAQIKIYLLSWTCCHESWRFTGYGRILFTKAKEILLSRGYSNDSYDIMSIERRLEEAKSCGTRNDISPATLELHKAIYRQAKEVWRVVRYHPSPWTYFGGYVVTVWSERRRDVTHSEATPSSKPLSGSESSQCRYFKTCHCISFWCIGHFCCLWTRRLKWNNCS